MKVIPTIPEILLHLVIWTHDSTGFGADLSGYVLTLARACEYSRSSNTSSEEAVTVYSTRGHIYGARTDYTGPTDTCYLYMKLYATHAKAQFTLVSADFCAHQHKLNIYDQWSTSNSPDYTFWENSTDGNLSYVSSGRYVLLEFYRETECTVTGQHQGFNIKYTLLDAEEEADGGLYRVIIASVILVPLLLLGCAMGSRVCCRSNCPCMDSLDCDCCPSCCDIDCDCCPSCCDIDCECPSDCLD